MDQQHLREILSGRARGPKATVMRAVLWLASKPYSAAMRIRRWLYRRGLPRQRCAGVPVISVGNVTTGGTGKTPMVAWVVGRLVKMGLKPAIVTRGYKCADGISDEAELLRQLIDAPVYVNPDRVAGARVAAEGGADVIVLDDGFQHRRLRRDLDIVLIDAMNPFGYGCVLPRGLLREPLTSLADADVVVITRSDAVEPDILAELEGKLTRAAPGAPVVAAVHGTVAVIDDKGNRLAPKALDGKSVCAFCGIANPDAFLRSVNGCGARIVCTRAFDDHVAYTMDMVEQLISLADGCAAELFVTTQKDAVKLHGIGLGKPLWLIAVEIQLTDGDSQLVGQIAAATSPIASAGSGG